MRIKLILLSVLLVSCSDFSMPSMPSVPSVPLLTPYKMDIRQGNYITPEMREKLKFGMSKSQVRYVMGTPMISDAFHGNRWDYVYRLERHGEIIEKQNLTLYFEGDNLARIDDGKTVQTAPVIEPQAVVPAVAEPVVSEPVIKIDPKADVLKSVQGWAAAWSAKNTRGYLAAYTSDFKPSGLSHDAWGKQRVGRINKPKMIKVALSDINVSVQDDSHATAAFTQNYQSDAYHDQMEKTLHLVRQSDRWLIAEELVGKPVATVRADQKTAPNGAEESVRITLKLWAEAWEARDVTQYLASYAVSFKPVGMSNAAWEAQRKERIGKAVSISVKISDMAIKLHDDSHASATFRQDYRSDSHQDSTRKTLQLEKVGNAWLIVSEQAAK